MEPHRRSRRACGSPAARWVRRGLCALLAWAAAASAAQDAAQDAAPAPSACRAAAVVEVQARHAADAELYRSAAAHEVAHAVVGCSVGAQPLPVPAHEYVAYVAMFATMAPELRTRVLARFPGRGFDGTLQINTIVYVADPLRFAVDAWRHYLARRDGAAWLRAVVAGHVVQEFPLEGP